MYIVVLVTVKNLAEAKKISRGLLAQELVACANIVKGVESLFRWEGKIDRAKEVLLIMKTKRSLFAKVVKAVKSLHSYATPEAIALPIIKGSKDYLKWVDDSTC